MASKKLRAIAVRGHDRIEPKGKEGLQACLKWFREHYNRKNDMLHKFGTSRNVMAMSADGILPTRNFREGQFEYAKEISGQTMAETILTDEGSVTPAPSRANATWTGRRVGSSRSAGVSCRRPSAAGIRMCSETGGWAGGRVQGSVASGFKCSYCSHNCITKRNACINTIMYYVN